MAIQKLLIICHSTQSEEILQSEPGVILLEMVQGIVDDAYSLQTIHLERWRCLAATLIIATAKI